MTFVSKKVACYAAAALVLSGCTIDRPTRSDGTGPAIDIAFSGGADFDLSADMPRVTPADSCAIVRDTPGGSVTNRSVDLSIAAFDRSGMNRLTFRAEGEGIRPGSITVTPSPNPTWAFDNGRDVDEVVLTYLPIAGSVINAGVIQLAIDSSFTGGVTISAEATDTFGNVTRLAPFELLSALADGTCNF